VPSSAASARLKVFEQFADDISGERSEARTCVAPICAIAIFKVSAAIEWLANCWSNAAYCSKSFRA
jgi:hypothetical protein